LRQRSNDKWRAKLTDPLLQAEIQAGRAHVSPLVKGLLLAFPPLPTMPPLPPVVVDKPAPAKKSAKSKDK